ncbi:MAG: FAD-dependent thymidylate synthase [Candidatus Hydrothermota bacterium]|nr:MAG: FAD-dependent thymidylate synthase [Candidatus Hydrothermae bacterium]
MHVPKLPIKEPILGGGFVLLEEMLGDDLAPARIARISYDYAGRYGKLKRQLEELRMLLRSESDPIEISKIEDEIRTIEAQLEEADRKLLVRLLELGHLSPFEQQVFRFLLYGIPMYVGEQILRHRIASPLKRSFRYTRPKPEAHLNEYIHVPPELLGVKDSPNFQPSKEEVENLLAEIERHVKRGLELYEKLTRMGLRKEAARTVLPWGLRTQFYWTINMRSLFNFLELRLSPAAQWETRQVAKAVARILQKVVPLTVNTFLEQKGITRWLET